MPDFEKALKEGLEAANKADAARQEIDEVFKDLNTQVLQATDNKVLIERREVFENTTDTGWSTIITGIRRLAGDKYWGIFAFNPAFDKNKALELARWAMDIAGYPCKLTWNKQEHICEDKEALVNSLLELLRDPVVGEKIYTLTKLEPKK